MRFPSQKPRSGAAFLILAALVCAEGISAPADSSCVGGATVTPWDTTSAAPKTTGRRLIPSTVRFAISDRDAKRLVLNLCDVHGTIVLSKEFPDLRPGDYVLTFQNVLCPGVYLSTMRLGDKRFTRSIVLEETEGLSAPAETRPERNETASGPAASQPSGEPHTPEAPKSGTATGSNREGADHTAKPPTSGRESEANRDKNARAIETPRESALPAPGAPPGRATGRAASSDGTWEKGFTEILPPDRAAPDSEQHPDTVFHQITLSLRENIYSIQWVSTIRGQTVRDSRRGAFVLSNDTITFVSPRSDSVSSSYKVLLGEEMLKLSHCSSRDGQSASAPMGSPFYSPTLPSVVLDGVYVRKKR